MISIVYKKEQIFEGNSNPEPNIMTLTLYIGLLKLMLGLLGGHKRLQST